MEFRILGPVEVRDGERTLTPTDPRQLALLAALLLDSGETVPSDRLVEAVWGATPPARPQTALRAKVDGLRRTLEPGLAEGAPPLLVAGTGGVRLDVDPESVDLRRFERLAGDARRVGGSDPVRAAALLREATALWHGPALTGVALAGSAAAAAARLNVARLTAIEDRVAAELAMGRHAALVPQLEELVFAHPRSERLLAQLMLALHRCGRSDDALRVCADGHRRLQPGPELRSLEQAIAGRDPDLGDPVAASSLTRAGTVVGMVVPPPPPAATEPATPAPAGGGRCRRSWAVTGTAALLLAGLLLGGVKVHGLRAGTVAAHAAPAASAPATPEATPRPSSPPAATPAAATPPPAPATPSIVPPAVLPTSPRTVVARPVSPTPAPVPARSATPAPTPTPTPAATPTPAPAHPTATPGPCGGDGPDGWDRWFHHHDGECDGHQHPDAT